MNPSQNYQKVTFSHIPPNIKKSKYTSYFVVLAIVKMRRRSKRSRHRKYVLEQWLKTQRSYKVDLQLAISYIKRPLLEAEFIDKDGVNVLCPQFQQMKSLSDMMISTVGIVEKEKNMMRIVIGPELIKFGNFYKLYGTYFGNRMRSEQLLKKLFQDHSAKMREFEQSFKKQAGSADRRKEHMSISNCLQQPQYRMFKYVLLLKEYIKKMPTYHLDYANIKQAQKVFEQINEKNNELMGKLEADEKKRKLDRLFGKSIPDSSQYIVEMTAETLYFPVKLYIFTNLVIVASVQKIFGFEEERRYLNIYLNQFSFIASKPDNKYFRNVTLLCGIYDAIHLFSADPGSKQEIVNCLQRVISKLQQGCCSKRKKQKGMGEMGGKLSFSLEIGTKQSFFAPQLRAEVMHVQVRPLGTFSNDTVYLTRFAGPLWLEDCALVGMEEMKLEAGPWQMVEVHLSKVKELYESLVEEYPQIQFPKIDPLTKEMNLFTQSKKNTKMFEVRGYLFQQFFNFILKNPTVMRSPLQIVHKFKFIPVFWQYIIKKNEYVSGRTELSKKQPQKYLYGEYHCNLCSFVLKGQLQELLKVRGHFLHGKRPDYCFNAFCLYRMRFSAMHEKEFDTIDKILLRELHQSGRMDYALLPRDELFKRYQQMTILACGQSQRHLVLMDYRRKVGEMIIDLGYFLGLDDALDCRLILRYENKERLLDQDQVLFDMIDKYQLPAVEREDTNRQSRYSVNVTSLNKQEGILSFFGSVFKSSIQSSLIFRKVIYLPKEIEIKTMMSNPRRGKYVIEELFARLSRGEIPFEADDWAEACTIWLILNAFQSVRNLSLGHLLAMAQQKIIPPNRKEITQDKSFLKIFADMMESFKKRSHQPLTDRQVLGYYRRGIRVFYRQVKSYSYLTAAVVHTVPLSVISDNKGSLEGECWLGINYKEFLVFRREEDGVPAVRLSLEDLKVTHTTFSLFLEYNSFVGMAMESISLNESQTSIENVGREDPKRTRLRFDAKLLYHFSYLMEVYTSLRKIFPSVIL